MYLWQVTITTTDKAQPVVADNAGVQYSNTRFQSIVPQNNGTNNMRLGDGSVSGTRGLLFPPGSSLGGAQAFNGPGNLLDFYVYGTSGDIMDFMVFP
jgi:hypothetical protein